MVDAMDGPYAAATVTAMSAATRSAHGEYNNIDGDFTIGGLLAFLHMQPYDGQMKQKISTGLLAQLLIPETIAFRSGNPMYPTWYLSSKADPGTQNVPCIFLMHVNLLP
jgi:hypothetical protein